MTMTRSSTGIAWLSFLAPSNPPVLSQRDTTSHHDSDTPPLCILCTIFTRFYNSLVSSSTCATKSATCARFNQPVQGDDQTQWGVVVIQNITERSSRHLQEELIALASHELRPPLTVLHDFLDLLTKELIRRGDRERAAAQAAALSSSAASVCRLHR